MELLDEGKVVGTTEQKLASKIEMEVPEAVLWSPSSPKLYHLNIELLSQGQVIDQVKSYFAMREVSIRKDECGYQRICLNGDPIFQYGTLDQGWWPGWFADTSFRRSNALGYGSAQKYGI